MMINEAPEKGWYIIRTVNDALYKGEFTVMKKRDGGFNNPMELVFENTQMYNRKKDIWNKSRYTYTVSMIKIKSLTKRINEPKTIPKSMLCE